MRLTLVRVGECGRGMFGMLKFGRVPFVLTLEQPWKDNQQNISCIPPGRYTCQSIRSPKFGATYEVMNVPGRTHILFHRGNYVEDTQGCILIGDTMGGTFDAPAIEASLRGFGEFMALVSGHATFGLDIVDATTLTADEPVTI